MVRTRSGGLGAKLRLCTLRYPKSFEDGKIEVPELGENRGCCGGSFRCAERRNHELWCRRPHGCRDSTAWPARSDGARRPEVDSVEYGVTESGEVVGDCEWAAGVPNQNAVGLPATKRQLLGSAKVFSVLRLIRVHEAIPALVSRRQRNSS